MQSAYPKTYQNSAQPHRAGHVARDGRHLLHAVWWLSRHWVERLAVDDPPRRHLIHLGILADDLVRVGDYSLAAMTAVRTLLCTNCRRLNAAQGGCSAQSLDRCPLLDSQQSTGAAGNTVRTRSGRAVVEENEHA